MGLLAGIGSVLSGIGAVGGLFGKKAPTPLITSIFRRSALAGRLKIRFQPVDSASVWSTGWLLGDGGRSSAFGVARIPGEIVSDFDPEVKADKERQRQADQLNLDLARLKLEQARSGVVIAPQSAVQSVGQGPRLLGVGLLLCFRHP
ncbi:hypothetical protein ACTTAL_09700 [Rhodobacter capsulatus]